MDDLKKSGGVQIARKQGEEIYLFVNGVPVRLYLAQVRGRQATIGIVADRKQVAILRGELLEGEKK